MWVKLFDNIESAIEKIPPNIRCTLQLDHLRICITNKDDKLFAFQEYCPHSGASLKEGICNNMLEIVCPLHGYRFDLISGKEAGTRCKDLIIYPISVRADGVFIAV